MKKIFVFFVLWLPVFVVGFFLDVAFQFRGALLNLFFLWFFIVAAHQMRPGEIVFAGLLLAVPESFLGAGSGWLLFFPFVAAATALVSADRFIGGAAGRFKFFIFSFGGIVAFFVARLGELFFGAARSFASGPERGFMFPPFFSWEIFLSAAALGIMWAVIFFSPRRERTYYV